jgi:hypothetical protein
MPWQKLIVGLLLLIVPWPIFILSAKTPGPMVAVALTLTLLVSAFGLTILIGSRKKER